MSRPVSAPVRIGNAQAFWGDSSSAAAEMLAREPELDYLTLDYLAEVSMSLLAKERERDPSAGYPRDFVEVVRSLAPYWAGGGRCRVIANAGGLNQSACASACSQALAEAGCRSLKIAVVSGDDVLERLWHETDDEERLLFEQLDTKAPLTDVRDRLVTANAYVGAAPIVKALKQGADIVITGRVADPSLTLAPCLFHFGWSDHDWDRIAGATIAGHLIECGTQVTGGISTDWLEIPDPTHLGFPIVEVANDGSCVVTKPRGTGGCVTATTVKEQLVYEIGDPGHYVSPDVTASFLSLQVEDQGHDRVRVSGAQGQPPPPTLKVSATYRDGYRAAGTLTIYGRDAVAKARRCGEIVLQRLQDSGHVLRASVVECLSTGACVEGLLPDPVEASQLETVLRIAVEAESRTAVEQFTRELMPLITAGPPGTTGYAEGRPRVHPVFRYWPCLIDRSQVVPRVELIQTHGVGSQGPGVVSQTLAISPPPLVSRESGVGSRVPVEEPASGHKPSAIRHPPSASGHPPSAISHPPSAPTLRDIACARSGDKGANANIGVLARRSEDYAFLRTWLTAERVAAYFRPLGVESVDRYEMPNLEGLNFILRGVLRNTLRTDAQGKVLGQALLELPVPDESLR